MINRTFPIRQPKRSQSLRRAWGGSATCRPKRQLRHTRHSRSSERQQPAAPRLSAGMGENNREDRFPSGPLSQGHLAQGRLAIALSRPNKPDAAKKEEYDGNEDPDVGSDG